MQMRNLQRGRVCSDGGRFRRATTPAPSELPDIAGDLRPRLEERTTTPNWPMKTGLSCWALSKRHSGLAPLLSDQEKPFHQKTLSENVCPVDEAVLREINTLVAQAGRAVFKKKKPVPLSRSAPRPTVTCWKPTCIFRPT